MNASGRRTAASCDAACEELAGAEPHARRRARLFARLDELGSVAVAFSGGVDSAVLLHAAHARLGARALAVIADSASLPRAELEAARALARSIGATLVELATRELEDPRYRANPSDRCYFCKQALFEGLAELCRERGIAHAVYGETADDRLLVRHGARAAAERAVVAPLADAGFTKDDVRRYAREHALACADKPASACLASRLPTGTEVTRERLARVERAERSLAGLGFRVLRVRDHGARARVELGADELERGERLAQAIGTALLDAGFADFELATYRAPSPVT